MLSTIFLSGCTYPLSVIIIAAQLQVISKHAVSKETHSQKNHTLSVEMYRCPYHTFSLLVSITCIDTVKKKKKCI